MREVPAVVPELPPENAPTPKRAGADVARPMSAPLSVATIHATIRQDIILLRLRPGTRVSENELARRFGTSRTPVREALLRLVEEGLIEVWPQRGTFITPISLQAVRRARFVREAMEVAILRRAAEQGLSAESRKDVDRAIAEQEAARDEPERFTRADDAFHRAFADGIDVGNIWAVLEREKAQFDRLRFLSLPDVTPVSTLISQHKAMLVAVSKGDVAAAEHAAREHLSEVLKVSDTLAATHPELIVDDT
ncbi:GntR family transcriptional regulator [Microvirga brassicacearum]|uniref:GntR family transcriptional regulator n=1 Tax=Microvirga brassicacearum TaxID=2580413 RepID=A0A5N3PCG3_9HYPH|nr:GntR family transcriptional regulator [Microvirga brassicacearum]KAB0267391.1 GntR family transcriptional regulator [Microvirga brassicacearum]